MNLNDIRRTLGLPYFQHRDVILYQTDGLRAMRELPHGMFDATITSPPDHIDNKGKEGRTLTDYISWSSEWMQEAYSLTKTSGSLWLGLGCTSVKEMGGQVPLPYLLWNRSDFYMMQEFPGGYPILPGKHHQAFNPMDKLLWLVKDSKHYYLDEEWMRNLVEDESNVDHLVDYNQGELSYALVKSIIQATTRPGDIILDPFVSGSTITQASKDLHRKVIGFTPDTDKLDHIIKESKEGR